MHYCPVSGDSPAIKEALITGWKFSRRDSGIYTYQLVISLNKSRCRRLLVKKSNLLPRGEKVIAVLLGGLLAGAVVLAVPAFGQGTTLGYISGEVTSISGSVAGASVTAFHPDSGRSRTVVADAAGRYHFTALSVGRYAVFAILGNLQSSIIPTDVTVGEGAAIELRLDTPRLIEEVIVIEEPESPLDVTRAETARIVTLDDIRRLPIPRDVSAVVLMAPGAVQGDLDFGTAGSHAQYGTGSSYTSLGGASVAENIFFINGMNLSNFRTGLGANTVPFEFYHQFQIKTGGYSPAFGRSTGGVVNAVTKRGGNQRHFVLGSYYEPGTLRSRVPNVEHPTAAGTWFASDGFDERDDLSTFISASGPLIKDRLFAYAIYEARNIKVDDYSSNGLLYRESDTDGFWGLKLDWLINDDHHLEYTGFSDARTVDRRTFDWDPASGEVGPEAAQTDLRHGGDTHILTYKGYFGDNFAGTVVWGINDNDLTAHSPNDDDCPVAWQVNSAGIARLGCWTNYFRTQAEDERENLRIDLEWAISNQHLLRFGMDREVNRSFEDFRYSGNQFVAHYAVNPGIQLSNRAFVPPGVDEVTLRWRFFRSGNTEQRSTAFYLEDEWTLHELNATLHLGLRHERFGVRNGAGNAIVRITDQFAPRIGISWDPGGEGNSRVFANYGRYHLPVATSAGIHLASARYSEEAWFERAGPIAADGNAMLGAEIGAPLISGGTSLPDVRTLADQDLKPMAQDEILLGYEQGFFDHYIVGITYTYRDLRQAFEDVAINRALGVFGEFNYVLINPGRGVKTFYDIDGNGRVDEVRLTADELGFPSASRRYHALTLDLQRRWDGIYYFRSSYTWSRSFGNYEGTVSSDLGEILTGVSSQFDFVGLTEGAEGYLPNDRRHQLKTWGVWEFRQGWQVNAAYFFSTGRPINAFGNHPTDPFSRTYGPNSFYLGGVLTPRGSRGTTPNVHRVDLGLRYTAENVFGGTLISRFDIFNVLDLDSELEVNEICEDVVGTARPECGLPRVFQQPRTVRLGLRFEF